MKKNEVMVEEGLSRRSGIPKSDPSELLHSGDERCHDCGKPLARGESLRTWYCQTIGLCRYCYRNKYPRRGRPKWPPITRGSQRLLSWNERRRMEQKGFNEEVWSPGFRKEMREYWRARMRGEV